MLFLSINQQCRSTEGNSKYSPRPEQALLDLILSQSTTGLLTEGSLLSDVLYYRINEETRYPLSGGEKRGHMRGQDYITDTQQSVTRAHFLT